MRRICICFLCLLGLLFSASCKQKRDVSEMSDEEKIALEVADESSLDASEKELQREARQAILDQTHHTQKGESEMQEALQDAHDVLDDAQYAALVKSQEQWLKGGRGKYINRLVDEGVPAAEAFAKSAELRAEWIRMHTSMAMLIDMPGKFGGFYRADQGRTLEIYEMNESIINLVIRMSNDVVFTASGIATDGKLSSELDKRAVISIQLNDDSVTIELGETFAQSDIASRGMLIEGRYNRIKPGEYDVFAP
ncbi:MAG: hypothetical protein J6A01_01655 [Proteobacteria bacterium]|nr:hypothetical protein [Pseudomonadota bacterium]